MNYALYLRAALLAALPLPGLAQSVATVSAAASASSLSGDWTGSLGAATATFHLQDPPGGPRAATLDIPAQRAKGVPLSFVVRADSVYLTLPAAVGRFAGRRAPDGQHLAGEWQQAGQALTLTLSRGGAAAAPKRPQTPQPPFPYESQDVTFQNAKVGITLAGTYTRPAGRGPFPAVVLLTGSGPEDRNETLFDHQPFAVLADYLTRRGVAVLRFDDRGVGQSGGTLAGTTSADYATDALAALVWLRTRPEIRKNRVGLVGHSEGGTAAITAAAQPQGPDLLVLLAAPGLPGDEMIVQQVLALNKLQTSDANSLATTEQRQRHILAAVTQNPDNEQARAQLLPLLNPGDATDAATLARVRTQTAQLTSPAYRHLLADRPAQTLPQVKCPVLALDGAKDVQVVAAPNLAAIRQGLAAGHNRQVTTRELPGLNHLFQTAPTGSPAEYGTIEETFAPTALQLIADWLTAMGN